MRTLIVLGIVLSPAMALAASLINGDFSQEVGDWSDGEGPPGWVLSLDDDHQRGIVEPADFAYSGGRVFRFSHLHRGFGGSRMDQCILVSDREVIQLSVMTRTPDPHPDLRVRLRVDFYADGVCDSDSANAGNEQIESDISLGPDRAPPDTWTRLESEARLTSELGEDVQSMRVSIRVRDRSDDGEPAQPPTPVFLDQVSLEAEVAVLPEAQRAALRALYTATGGDDWHRNAGWMSAEGTECQWFGVTCAPGSGELMRLDLPRNNLQGALPTSIGVLDGLDPGGLDLCWNGLSVADEATEAFVEEFQLGGGFQACAGQELVPFDAQRGGSLYHPDRSGEGFALHMEGPSAAQLYWNTFDFEGKPVWLYGHGRVNNRVLSIETLYRAERVEGQVESRPMGRATLAFTGCSAAEFRFDLFAESLTISGTRPLQYTDGVRECDAPPAGVDDPQLLAMRGLWYDPHRSGEGLSMEPATDNRLVFNWYTFDEGGMPVWMVGLAHRNGDAFITEELRSPAGGHPVDDFDPEDLEYTYFGHAHIDGTGTRPALTVHHADGEVEAYGIQLLQGGPRLVASSGNRLDLEMDPDDVELLYSRDPFSDDRLPGSFRFFSTDEFEPLHGLRFRGNSSRQHPKKSFNIRFETPQALLFGSDRMNLNSMYTDPGMMRESLAMRLFRDLGQPAPRTRYFDFWLNGVYEGLHIHIERVDEHLLASNGLNPDGTLIRDRFRQTVSGRRSVFGFDLGEIPAEEREDFLAGHFDYRGDPEWGALVELVEWVYATPPGPEFAAGFEERFEVENFVDWLVLHWLIGDIDSWDDDFWLYIDHEAPDARWHVIPWDKDQSFGSHFRTDWFTANDFFAYQYPLNGGATNELTRSFVSTPPLRALAHERLEYLMNSRFTAQWLKARMDEHVERLRASVGIGPGPGSFEQHNQNHHGELDRLDDHLEALKDYVDLRFRFIERHLNPLPIFPAVPHPANPVLANEAMVSGDGERRFLTDSAGFTPLSVKPVEPWPDDFLFSVRVDPAPWTGIDRTWTVDVEHVDSQAELVLYYQNDVVSWLAYNWWTLGEEPKGCQDFLVMHRVHGDEDIEPLESRVNPYSNRVSATVDLEPGTHRFALILDEDAAHQAGCLP